jgi:hypothetical protein
MALEPRRLIRIGFGILAGGLVVAVLLVAVGRARNASPLDGRWGLYLIELPTESIAGFGQWIEFDGGDFVGAGDCTTFDGRVDFSGEHNFAVASFSTTPVCSSPTAIDRAIEAHFQTLTVHKGYLTLQTSDASIQFNYEWAP